MTLAGAGLKMSQPFLLAYNSEICGKIIKSSLDQDKTDRKEKWIKED